jgi:hypothetical protein
MGSVLRSLHGTKFGGRRRIRASGRTAPLYPSRKKTWQPPGWRPRPTTGAVFVGLHTLVRSGWMRPAGAAMSKGTSGWGRKLKEPIALPDGQRLVVLRDAADYITSLPKKESALPEWQAAIEVQPSAQRSLATDIAGSREQTGKPRH